MGKYSEEELKAVHESTAFNEVTTKKSTLMGCFYCCKTFPPSNVQNFIEKADYKWAHCPICSIDSVISDNGTGFIDPQLLDEMRLRYFGE